MKNTSNGLTAILLGVYLAAVTYKGNTSELGQMLKRDWRFVLWAGALVLLLAIKKNKLAAAPVSALITAAGIGFVLLNYKTIQQQFNQFALLVRGQGTDDARYERMNSRKQFKR